MFDEIKTTMFADRDLGGYTIKLKDVTWGPEKGKEPNWFHRKMQKLLLGIEWEKRQPDVHQERDIQDG